MDLSLRLIGQAAGVGNILHVNLGSSFVCATINTEYIKA